MQLCSIAFLLIQCILPWSFGSCVFHVSKFLPFIHTSIVRFSQCILNRSVDEWRFRGLESSRKLSTIQTTHAHARTLFVWDFARQSSSFLMSLLHARCIIFYFLFMSRLCKKKLMFFYVRKRNWCSSMNTRAIFSLVFHTECCAGNTCAVFFCIYEHTRRIKCRVRYALRVLFFWAFWYTTFAWHLGMILIKNEK